MKFKHEINGFEGKHLVFCLTIDEDINLDSKKQIHLEIISHNFLSDLDHSIYMGFFSSFNHHLTLSFNKRASKNSILFFYQRIITQMFYFYETNDQEIDKDIFLNEVKKLITFCKKVQNAFLDSLDLKILKLSRKFSHDRWKVYTFLKIYEHPYLLQLVETAPGIIAILAVCNKYSTAINPKFNDEGLDQVIKFIYEGRGPKFILNFIIEFIIRNPANNSVWSKIIQNTPKRINEIKENWIWININAPASCGALTLLTPPPFVIHKSDLPKNKRVRANWIKRIKMIFALMIPENFSDQVSIKQLEGLALMLSKSSDFSYKYIKRRKQGLILYLNETKRVPSKNTDYKKFFNEVRVHNKENNKIQLHKKKLFEIKINEILSLNNGVIHEGNLHIKEAYYEIEALTRIEQLKLESERMNNCVANQIKEAFLKKFVHFHVRLNGKDFTLALVPSLNIIHDFKGIKNEKPNEEEMISIKEVLKYQSVPIQMFLDLNKTPVDLEF